MQHSKKLKISSKLSTDKLSYLVFSFLSGILCGAWFYLLQPNLIPLIIQTLLSIFLIVVLLKHDWRNAIAFVISCTISLILIHFLTNRGYETNNITGIVIEKHNNYFIILSNKLRRYYVYEKGSQKNLFEVVRLSGYTKKYETLYYDNKIGFSDSLKRKGVFNEFVVSSTTYLRKRTITLNTLRENYLSNYSLSTQNLIKSLVFGDIDYNDGLFSYCSEIQLLYFLRSSGLTYNLVKKQKDQLLEYVDLDNRFTKVINIVLECLLFTSFFHLIGVRRIFLKNIFNRVNKQHNNKYPSIMIISLSGLVMIFFNIWNVYNIGFLIGLGISFYFSLSRRIVFKRNKKDSKINSYLTFFILLLPFHCSKGCFPICLPLLTLVLPYITIPFVLLNYISMISVPFVYLINNYAGFIRRFLEFIYDVNINTPIGGSFDFSHVVIYYAFVIFVTYLIDSGFRVNRKYLLSIVCMGLCFKSLPLHTYITSEVTFLNIGQGDCTIIRDSNKVVMIDTGGNLFCDIASEVDIPYLRRNKIYHIDYLIITHADYDHMGAASSLTKKFPVYNFCYKKSDFPLQIGNLRFENLNKYNVGKDENSKSLVLYMEFLGQRWLFPGDAPKEVERNIIKDNPHLRVDVLKLGHHGSKTSSDEAFLKHIQPKMGVISCGRNNMYKHPNKETLDTLNKLNIPYIRTDELNTISYKSYFGRDIKSVYYYKTRMKPI